MLLLRQRYRQTKILAVKHHLYFGSRQENLQKAPIVKYFYKFLFTAILYMFRHFIYDIFMYTPQRLTCNLFMQCYNLSMIFEAIRTPRNETIHFTKESVFLC